MSFWVKNYASIISGTVAGIVAGVVVSLLLSAAHWCWTHWRRSKQIKNVQHILMHGRMMVLGERKPDRQREFFNGMKHYFLKDALEHTSPDLYPEEILSIKRIVDFTTMDPPKKGYKRTFDQLENLKWLNLPACGSKAHRKWQKSILIPMP